MFDESTTCIPGPQSCNMFAITSQERASEIEIPHPALLTVLLSITTDFVSFTVIAFFSHLLIVFKETAPDDSLSIATAGKAVLVMVFLYTVAFENSVAETPFPLTFLIEFSIIETLIERSM